MIYHLIFDPAGKFTEDLELYALVSLVCNHTLEVHIHDPNDISNFVKVLLPPG